MDKAFEEELKHHGLDAWFGYIRKFSDKCYFVFKHKSKFQRPVKCKKCGAKIPKEAPRIFISGSWYYYTGHYCLKCAGEKIRDDIFDKEQLQDFLSNNLKDLKTLLEVLEKTKQKEKYKDYMAMGILCSKLEPKKEY